MARLQSLKSTAKGAWHEYGGWVVLIVTAYVLWTFRKVFSSLGDAAGDSVGAAVANTQANAQVKAAQVKVSTATGSSTKYTPAQLAQFEADATSMASFLGQANLGLSTVFKDKASAFSLIKLHYSRLVLKNNKPIVWTGGKDGDKNRPFKNVATEVPTCVKNATNYKVLAPFYKEITSGRDLVGDFRYFVSGSEYTTYFKWIL